jgi:hypothetical protein
MALDPGALETNRAGRLSKGQRSKLRARATGALLAGVGCAVFALIAWWSAALTGAPGYLVAPAAIATLGAPLALWAFDRILTDLRNGQVIRVTGIAVVTAEPDSEDNFFRVRLQGRRLRVPSGVEEVLRAPGQVTAFFTPWSGMLVNLAPAED